MIVVDTSVWIDFFAGRSDLPHVATMRALVADDAHIGITDVILTEVLQGIRSDAMVHKVENVLSAFEVARLENLDDYGARLRCIAPGAAGESPSARPSAV